MLKKYSILLLFTACLFAKTKATNDAPSYINYIKNNGQWDDKVLYQGSFKGGRVFLEKNAFTYLFYPQDGLSQLHPHHKSSQGAQSERSNDGIKLNFHAVRMEFIGCSANATTQQTDKQPFYHNYYLGSDTKKWASNVPVSQGVNYADLYQGISLKTFSNANNVRYDFTINPLADASVIKLKFTGQNNLSIKEGNLIIGTSVGNMVQPAPYTYQIEDGREQKIACKYTLQKDIVSIEVTGTYNHNLPLIIDPTLVFATFTGSTADNWGMTASYDNGGNGYTAGICFGTGYPVTTGAFQQTFAGGVVNQTYSYMGFDIVASKFDPTGSNLLFSTYLGGSNNEEPESIIVDNGDNLLVLGRSYSSNFPITAGAYDVSLNGGADIIITKFNATGTALLASTFIGGSGDDGVNYSGEEDILGSLKYNYADDGRGDIILDNTNNVYIASCTQSTDFPTTAGCVQPASKGMQDGCVFKLNATLSTLIWSTYLGGSANDAAYNLAIDNGNGVYVTGGTESADFTTTSGALHPSYMGNMDGFLTHISSSGNALLQSTYVGTSGYDQSYFVQLDKLHNVYIFGQTSGGYPITSGVYSNPNSGQFIHEFNSTLSATIFSTEFGTGQGAPDIAPSAFLVDNCSNIYISGWGGTLGNYNIASSTTNGLPVTPNAFQPTTDGEDFYFMVLQPNATALWYATYFGGDIGSEEHVDGGTSRFDKSGVIYQAICEGCAVDPRTNYTPNSDMPTTPGAWSTTNNSNNCNNALVKFSFNLLQTVAALSINPSSAIGCAPFNVSFTNFSQNANQYKWSFGDGDTSTVVSPAHTYTTPGSYTVTLTAKDTATCNVLDSIVAVITVNAPPIITVNSATICVGSHATLTASGASSYTWNTGNTTASITQNPIVNTTYMVTGTSSASCTNTAVANVVVNPLPIVTVNSATICAGDTTTLTAAGASTYSWNTMATTPTIVQSPQANISYYSVTGTDINLCVNTATATIILNPLPVITISNLPICIGNTGTLTANGASTYTWSTGAATTSITASPTITTTYTVTGTNNNGCINKKTATLIVNPLPVISVNTATLCAGSSTVLIASGASTYVWNTTSIGALVTLSPTVTTNYTVVGTDINYCKDTATTSITVFATPTLSVSNDSICIGSTATITATSTSPNYSWSTGETSQSISPSPTVTTTYTVSSRDSACTNQKVSKVIVLVNRTHLQGGGHIGMCVGDSVKLQTFSTYTSYVWSTGQTTPTIEANHAGTYTVQTIDIYGCKGEDSTKVYADSKVPIPLQDTTICRGVSVQLEVTQGAYVYLWSPANSLDTANIYNPIANPTSTTVYTVTVTNGGCINTNTVTIFVRPLPSINVNPKYSLVMAGEAVNLQAQAADSCIWSPTDWLSCNSCNTNISVPYQDVTYTITTTNSFGCSASIKAEIKIDIESTFYIPNTFSPNGDEKNEIFKPAYTNIHNFKIDVFDRWGLQLFQSNNPDNGWDGTYKNGKCQEDVYVYKAEYYDDATNTRHTASGTVTLIR